MGKANAFLLLFSLFVVLTIGEFMTRYFHHAWPFDVEMATYSHLTSKDAPLRWRFTPNENRNSLGLRNREVFKKADGQYRILFLGDSLIWSGYTNSGDLYTQVIERNLRRELGKQAGEIEVINAGIPGYTTYQELEFLKLYGVPMEPDFLVLGFVFNDVYYKYLHKPVAGSMIGEEPSVNLNRFDKRSFPGFLFKDSYLAHDVVYYFERAVKKITRYPCFEFEQRGDFFLAWKDYGWYHTRELIGEMRDLLAESGIGMLIVIFPVSEQVIPAVRALDEEQVLYPQSRIKEICESYDIPCLDLTDQIVDGGGASLYKDYLHLNGAGNDIVAKEITRFLMKNRFLWIDRAASGTKK